MWKAVLAGVSMIAIAGSSFVYAQQRGPAGESAQLEQFQRGPTAEDVSALIDARVAALRAAAKLTPEQEKNWPPVEQAVRALAQQRFDHMATRRNTASADPIERLRQRADFMAERSAGLRRLADAAQPLYQSLDESQRRRLAFVMRRSMGMGMGGMGMHHGIRGGMGFDDDRPGGGMGPGMGPGRGMGPGGPGMGPGPGGPGMGPGPRQRL